MSYDVMILALTGYFLAVCLDLAYRAEQVRLQDGIALAAVLAVPAAFPAFAASKTAVGKIYLTIDSTVGLKNDSEDVTVTPYGDNTDLYYVDNIYIENNDGNGYTESNPPKITVTLEVADEDNYYFSGTASKDFRLTLSDSAKNGYGKAEYVKAVKKNDRSTVELTFRLTFDKKTTASTTSTVKAPTGVAWSPNAYGTGIWSAVSGAKYYQLRLLKDGSLTGDGVYDLRNEVRFFETDGNLWILQL